MRLLPDLVARVGELAGPISADPDTERHRLHTALSDLLASAGRRVPPHHLVQLEAVLTQMNLTNSGNQALAAAGLKSLRSADSSAYDDVWAFLVTYARLFGYWAPGVEP